MSGKNLEDFWEFFSRGQNHHFLTFSRFWRKSINGWCIFDDLIWNYRVSVNSSRKPHVRERSRWFLRKFFVRRVGCFEWSIQLLAIFSSLVHQINLIWHILIILNSLNNLTAILLMLDHSTITKKHFWMIRSAKKVFFGHFLVFGLLDWLDVAH